MSERAAGILMPISSLPSEYGIGCFSKSAYEFVDWLKGDSPAWTDQLWGFSISVLFYICRKSVLYQSGRTDRGRCSDACRM